jgi:hypothetical protein
VGGRARSAELLPRDWTTKTPGHAHESCGHQIVVRTCNTTRGCRPGKARIVVDEPTESRLHTDESGRCLHQFAERHLPGHIFGSAKTAARSARETRVPLGPVRFIERLRSGGRLNGAGHMKAFEQLRALASPTKPARIGHSAQLERHSPYSMVVAGIHPCAASYARPFRRS